MYNIMMDDNVLETRFMYQPRGEGTRWFFRMVTDGVFGGAQRGPKCGDPDVPEGRWERLAMFRQEDARRCARRVTESRWWAFPCPSGRGGVVSLQGGTESVLGLIAAFALFSVSIERVIRISAFKAEADTTLLPSEGPLLTHLGRTTDEMVA